MQRMAGVTPPLFVPFLPVPFQTFPSFFGPALIKPAIVQHLPHVFDPAHQIHVGRDPVELQTHLTCCIHPADPAPQFPHGNIMRRKVTGVPVFLFPQYCHIMPQAFPVGGIVIDHTDLLTVQLEEPDRGIVTHAQVPTGINWQTAVIGHSADPVLPVDPQELFAVIRSVPCLLERFIYITGELLPHGIVVLLFLLRIPRHLTFRQLDSVPAV